MLVTSQLPTHTTKLSIVFLTCACAPPFWKRFRHPCLLGVCNMNAQNVSFTTSWGTDRRQTHKYIKDKNRKKNRYEKWRQMFLCKTIRQIEIAHYWSISLDITLWNVNRKEILQCNAILISVIIIQSYRQSFLAFATANLSIISSKNWYNWNVLHHMY